MIIRAEKAPNRAPTENHDLSAVLILGDALCGHSTTLERRQVSGEDGVALRTTADGKGDGVVATRPFAAGETVMVGFLVGALTSNDSHATQVGPDRWARHGGLGPTVNHSCDPNCGVRLNEGQAFDFVARRAIGAGQEVTFDYAMRNYTIDHFPLVCLCGAARCRGSVTGWKDLPAARKADYGELVAPYLHTIDNEIIQRALRPAAEELENSANVGPVQPPHVQPAPRGAATWAEGCNLAIAAAIENRRP